MTATLILSSLGGIVSFITGVAFVTRAILKNVTATRDNTKALADLTKMVQEIKESDESQNVQIAILNDRIQR